MPIELLAIVLGAVLLLVLINVTQKVTSGLDRTYYQKKWRDIQLLHKTGTAGARLSVIEADKLLDHALKALHQRGETMGDRLKSAGKMLGDQTAVWDAHRLRNRLVHEEVRPKPKQLRAALGTFGTCLKRLGAL